MSNNNRKIELPNYCSPFTGRSIGGSEECEHDYPPESKVEHDTYVEWTCSKCGMIRSYEVYD
jgi:hypothetical protein